MARPRRSAVSPPDIPDAAAALRRRAAAVAQVLEREYGRHRIGRADPLEALIRGILSQNTTDLNSHHAYARLRERFPTWDQVAAAQVRSVEAAIRPGGLAHTKAPRIRDLLRQLRRERGALSLDFLAELSDEEARSHLAALPGVGLKTANIVLLFALGRQVFPVDTHVLRLSRRLEWIGQRVTAARAHRELERLIAARLRGALHLNLIAHGRRVCKARRPQCAACALEREGLCPYPRRHGSP